MPGRTARSHLVSRRWLNSDNLLGRQFWALVGEVAWLIAFKAGHVRPAFLLCVTSVVTS